MRARSWVFLTLGTALMVAALLFGLPLLAPGHFRIGERDTSADAGKPVAARSVGEPETPGRREGSAKAQGEEKPKGEEKPAKGDEPERKIERIYLTTAEGTPYQIRRVYAPRAVPADRIPDTAVTLEAAGYAGAEDAPKDVLLFESESEVRINTFGRLTVTVAGIKQWVDRRSGNVLAFDFAQTTGTLPQRVKGHLVKGGVRVRRIVGEEEREGQTVPLPKDAFIPPDMDFIRRYFAGLVARRKDPKVPEKAEEGCTFSLFVPEAVGAVTLSVRPAGEEVAAVEGRNVPCAKYEAWAAVSSAARSRQFLLFSQEDGSLVRRLDYDESCTKVTQVTERVGEERAKAFTELVVRPPRLESRPFEEPMGRPTSFRVRARDQQVGTLTIRFDRETLPDYGKDGFVATAEVDISTSGARRREKAVTRFDARMLPLSYSAEGHESVEHQADYRIEIEARGGKAVLRETRKYRPPDPKNPGVPKPPADPPDRKLEFPLSEGVFFFDYHRVEHVIAMLSQIPLVHDSRPSVAVFLVRRNLPALVTFHVRDLRRPAPGAEKPEHQPDGAAWEITGAGIAMPGRARLDGNGRLLSFLSQSGGVEMTYVSEAVADLSAVQKKRPERAEGPRPLRPSDW